MLLRIFTILALAISIHISANGADKNQNVSFLEQFRPYIRQYLGSEMELKILGKTVEEQTEDAIKMPIIPEIKEDVTSTAVYEKKADKVVLSAKDEEKYYRSFARDLYKSVRRQDPTDEEMGKILGMLLQNGSREGIYRSLVLDEVYARMENYDLPVSSKAADLTVHLYSVYLGKKLEKEKLKGINFYSLKRLVAERALEIVDSFGDNREAIENWYAIFSSDIATRHGQNFSNNLRKNPKKSLHKKWAQKSPVQHIKSEVVIKIHTAMNALMD